MDDEIKNAIGKLGGYLKGLGFKKKSLTWYKEKKEFILVIDLQRSAWSPEYYMNVGILFEKTEMAPKTYKCEVQYRVVHMEPKHRVIDIYKIEEEIKNLIQLLQKQVINVFENLEAIEEVKKMIITSNRSYTLTVRAKKILKIE